jgi:hypothetical protein
MPAYVLLLSLLLRVLWVLPWPLLRVWAALLLLLLLLAPVHDSRAASRVGGPMARGLPSLSTWVHVQHVHCQTVAAGCWRK